MRSGISLARASSEFTERVRTANSRVAGRWDAADKAKHFGAWGFSQYQAFNARAGIMCARWAPPLNRSVRPSAENSCRGESDGERR
jgi:hypothetical protein